MNSISWGGFDGGRFQRLCNSVIHALVSKRTKLYTAPGRDGGIDQYYTGAWEGLSGKWRFQDKFKNIDKATALSQLRADVRKDIKDHIADENFIVYLTNVDLLPQDETELEDIASATLHEEGIDPIPIVFFWHHGKLETMIRSCPVIENQFFAIGEPLLEPYQTHFSPQLTSADLRYQLANRFIGRQRHLGTLAGFLEGPETLLAITAPGDMGKTRLALQFFQQVVDADDTWLGLVLKPEGFSATSFAALLASDRKMVILLDDAHRHTNILAGVKNEVDKKGGQVKLIFTTRKNLYPDVKKAIPSHARKMIELPLDILNPTDTKEMYRSLLPGQPEENLQWLRERSNGLPGVIVANCYQIRHFGHPIDVAADQSFVDSVVEQMDQAMKTVVEETSLSARQVREFIHLVALVGPVKATPAHMANLEKMLGTTTEDFQAIGRSLEKAELVSFRDTLVIKPDPVGDAILRKLCLDNPSWIKKVAFHIHAGPYLENIVTNLSVLEMPDDPETSFIPQLLGDYLQGLVDPAATEEKIRSILQTAIKLSFRLPDVCIKALELFLSVSNDPVHALHHKGLLADESPLQKLRTDATQVLVRLIRGTTEEDAPARYFPLFLRCVKQFGNPHLIHPCFGFSIYDFETSRLHSGPCCNRQLYLSSAIKDYFASDDPTEVDIALAAFKSLYVHDFLTAQTFDRYTGEFTHGQAYVPDCSHVRQLRLQLLEGLIIYHRKHRNDPEEPAEWMKQLARVLLYLFVPGGKGSTINETDELAAVTRYFTELLRTDVTITERAEITRYLHISERRELKPTYNEQYQLLEDLLIPKMLKQRLELFLTAIDHYSERRKRELQRLVAEFSDFEEFVAALKYILTTNHQLEPSALNDLAHFLGEEHPELSSDLLGYVIDNAPGYIPALSSIADYLLSDEMEFFAILDRIWNLDEQHSYAATVIATLISQRRRSANQLNRRDLEYIAWAIAEGSPTSRYQLDHHLHRYADLDAPWTFSLLKQLGARPGHDAAGGIIYAISMDKPFCHRHRDQVMNLFNAFLKHTWLASGNFRPALLFIEEQHGQESLFLFVTEQARIRSEDSYFSFQQHRLFYGHTYSDSCAFFRAYFTWFLSYSQPLKKAMRDGLLQFFLPQPPSNQDQTAQLEQTFLSLIDEHSDAAALEYISVCIQGFYPYNAPTLSLQCRLVDKHLALFPSSTDVESLIGHHFVINIEIGKSGNLGQPYIQDVKKATFLREFINNTPVSPPIVEVLHRALTKVETDIEQTTTPITWQE